MHRRELFRFAVTGAVLARSAASSAWAPTSSYGSSLKRASRGLAFYDERYNDAHSFARAMVQEGAVVVKTGRDLARRWHQLLHGASPIGTGTRLTGLTPHSDLVLVRAYAAEMNLSLGYEGIHDCRGSVTLTHRLRHGLVNGDTLAEHLRAERTDWSADLARNLCRIGLERGSWCEQTVSTSVRRSGDNPGTLVSWLLF